jgi:hypothetical protein
MLNICQKEEKKTSLKFNNYFYRRTTCVAYEGGACVYLENNRKYQHNNSNA